MSEFHDAAGKTLLHPVKLADLDAGSNFAMQSVDPRQRDVLAENGRTR